jgi:hypothetical protein
LEEATNLKPAYASHVSERETVRQDLIHIPGIIAGPEFRPACQDV